MSMQPMNNEQRRYEKWAGRSVVYQIITWIPFHIVNWILAEIEFNFCPQCPWCKRQYFSSKKAMECCADIKASRGRYPGMSYVNGGGIYGAGSATYDRTRDCYHDYNTGATYTRDDH